MHTLRAPCLPAYRTGRPDRQTRQRRGVHIVDFGLKVLDCGFTRGRP
jgi:hypothetical protein